jgi:hypothetical protein
MPWQISLLVVILRFDILLSSMTLHLSIPRQAGGVKMLAKGFAAAAASKYF